MILGGSQGSAAINSCVFSAVKALSVRQTVVHITGKCDKAPQTKGYIPIEYASDIADLYAAAHTVVTRGGAGALSEISSLGKRMIVIPLPKSRFSRGDQVENAEYYQKKGLCRVIPEERLGVNELLREVDREAALPCLKPTNEHAAEKVARVIAGVIRRNSDY